MNSLDIVLLVLFVPGIIRGLTKGALEQVISLAGIVISAILAKRYYLQLATWAGSFTELSPTALNVAGFVAIMVICTTVIMLISRVLTKVVEMASLGWVNRVAGVVISCLVTALVLGLMASLVETLNQKTGVEQEIPLIKESQLYPVFRDFANKALPFLKEVIENGKDTVA